MTRLTRQGQLCFGIAIIAFGVENVVCSRMRLVVAGVPWLPESPFLGYLTGAVFCVAGVSIVANLRTRLSAILLGILFLFFVVLEVPQVAENPTDIGVRTVFFEALALGASALTLAGTLSPSPSELQRWDRALGRLTASGPFLLGISALVFGVDHFLILGFIASLVPSWLPYGLFWAYLTGAAFIAAGLSIVTKWLDLWAAFWLGMMFALWFLILHSPRVVVALRSHDPTAPDEWSSAFIALGLCGGYWIYAWGLRHRRKRQDASGAPGSVK